MPNPVRPWQKFITAWERLDLTAQTAAIAKTRETLRLLRAARKDIDGRITYWENNLKLAEKARRSLEFNGRSREREDRLYKQTGARRRGTTMSACDLDSAR